MSNTIDTNDSFEQNRYRYFSDEEFHQRIDRVKAAMAAQEIDACIVTNPENIYYLTGLNHQGYFAYTALILSLDKTPVLISRAMEKAIVRDMVIPGIKHSPYSDGVPSVPKASNPENDIVLQGTGRDEEGRLQGLNPWSMPSLGQSVHTNQGEQKDYVEPARVTCEALKELGLSSARIAFEQNSSFLPYKIANGMVSAMESVHWLDAGDIINDCRIIQSPRELECTRKTAAISDSMYLAGMAATGPGQSEASVMASIYQVMLQRGSTYPAYVPLIRSTSTIDHEHGTWRETPLSAQDMLFMEFSGSVWRYHAPIGRLVHIGEPPKSAVKIHDVCHSALMAAADAIKPGVTADSVYASWQGVVDDAGMSYYRRHHCGYIVGIGFPPCWSGSGVPRSLRHGSDLVIQKGMVFLLMSWLLRTGEGDAFLCDTIEVTEHGCQFLTTAPRELIAR